MMVSNLGVIKAIYGFEIPVDDCTLLRASALVSPSFDVEYHAGAVDSYSSWMGSLIATFVLAVSLAWG